MMYGLPPEGLMRKASCPKYHDYKHREQMAARKARLAARKGNHGAGRKWAAAADQWRARASAALRECIEAAGHYGTMGDYTCEGCQGYGAYGGCGHCGTSACPDGQYGGCGTFFGKSKDETKRACWLEKKIAKHQECCARDCSWFSGKGNQSNQCAKVARAEAELLQLTGGEGGASDLSQQADAQLAMAFQQANAMSLTNAAESAKTDQMLGIAALAGGGLLLVMALR